MKSRRWRAGTRKAKGRGLRPARTFADRERERWEEFIKPEKKMNAVELYMPGPPGEELFTDGERILW